MKKNNQTETTIKGNNIEVSSIDNFTKLVGVESYIENERKLVEYNPETKILKIAASPQDLMHYFSREQEKIVRIKTGTGYLLEFDNPATINCMTEGKTILRIDGDNYFTSTPRSLTESLTHKVRKLLPN